MPPGMSSDDILTPEEVTALLTQGDGTFRLARWGRPIAPVIFGLAEESLPVFKGAIEAVVTLAGHKMAEVDPELGANLMVFFVADWGELTEVPDLDRLIPGLSDLVQRLIAKGANQYRTFRFDEDGAIKAAFVFLRLDEAMAEVPAETLALGQAAQVILLWSPTAFAEVAPLARLPEGGVILRPEIAALIAAAYDPVLPPASTEPAMALRLAARLSAAQP